MTDSERAQILKMINDGKISAEEGLRLMQALDEDDNDNDEVAEMESSVEFDSEQGPDPEIAGKINKLRGLWTIPLWIGVVFTVGGASLMFSALQNSGLGFWFICAWLPFLLGVLFIALAWSSRYSNWIYVDVNQKPGEKPQRIVFGFPLPIRLFRWGVKNFGHHIPNEHRWQVDEVMNAVAKSTSADGPIFVDVHDDDGDHVQVYIG